MYDVVKNSKSCLPCKSYRPKRRIRHIRAAGKQC